ncbi:uncharacterized protein LOC125231043 [Leguminivora glycinivorella]|uniref:uncharacterized protein LOC125231043 n=1 Tax=Leguminivora glycinivorella TaxID=1035111 RepID=UPI00200EBE1C|nr:uncharacterized protein LOC125231043 [Leguminivora glycinivorella]
MYHFDLCLLCVLFAIIHTVDSKRYDIEEECKNEYGLDLQSLLRQFRRSDDYVKILKMRTNEFGLFFADVIFHSLDWNYHKLKEEIKSMYGLNKTTASPETSTTTTPPPQTVCVPGSGTSKTCPEPGPVTVPASRQLLFAAKARMLQAKFNSRRSDNKNYEQSLNTIRAIDRHPKLKSYLTVDERNQFREMAFEYAGETIHTAIRAFGGDPLERRGITQMDVVGPTTTQHAMRHVVGSRKEKEDANSEKTTKRYLLVSNLYPSIVRDG